MDVLEAMLKRRSVRSYLPKAVPRTLLGKMLEAARWAPSGGNVQAWKFIVVRDSRMVQMLRIVSPGMFGEPPAAIVICSDKKRYLELGSEMEYEYMAVADCALATENLVLAAHSLGLATCIVKSFAEAAVSELLELPKYIRPELIVSIGYAMNVPQPPPKLALSEIAYADKFGRPWKDE